MDGAGTAPQHVICAVSVGGKRGRPDKVKQSGLLKFKVLKGRIQILQMVLKLSFLKTTPEIILL